MVRDSSKVGKAARLMPALLLASAACAPLEEVRLYRAVQSIEIGAPEADVLKRLGPPIGAGAEFHLAQEKGFEEHYRAAAASASVRYLFWGGGVDVVCAVGLDREHRVSYKACGGT